MTVDEKYNTLFKLVLGMRSSHWEAKNYGSKTASQKSHRLGLEIDKFLREENQRIASLKKELDNG